ncbi:unnamed protein product [Spirodela intermedia]|uniref:Uncharacterized protein n=1 Tax=Spirodela intermedia TaxID=51605 RepID=A0A7I8K0L6_SPIIN|nr:unnamed protein product [Spirodela intermedia]
MVGPSTPIGTIRRIQGLTGFSHGHLPFEYLGCLIFLGRRCIHYFDALVGKLRKKLAGWKLQLLSPGGRIQLIHHVLMSMPLHLLAVHEWKLNVDGVSQGNPGPSGVRGILRDSTRCILFVFSNFYNIRTNTEAEAIAQEYLGRHHAMPRTHHNHYASVPRRESDSRRPCYAWSQIASEDNLLRVTSDRAETFSIRFGRPTAIGFKLLRIENAGLKPLFRNFLIAKVHFQTGVFPRPESGTAVDAVHSPSGNELAPYRRGPCEPPARWLELSRPR